MCKKTVFMYKILNAIREDMQANGQDTGYISQAMVDLVHTSGFGNPLYTAMLKSENPRERIEGINKILNERDSIAITLGFENHFFELQQFLNVDHPTGSTKREDLAEVLREIEKDIESMPYTVTQTSVLRVRPLSLCKNHLSEPALRIRIVQAPLIFTRLWIRIFFILQ